VTPLHIKGLREPVDRRDDWPWWLALPFTQKQ
jgi:hypothetical protein